MTLTDDDMRLLADLRWFIAEAQRAEAALVDGRIEEARYAITYVAGISIGLASRVGISFAEAIVTAGKLNMEKDR